MAKKKFLKNNILQVPTIKTERDINYPVFCFKHLQNTSIRDCNDIVFRQFINRAMKLAELGWTEIDKSDRHSFGYEKIKKSQIKCALPAFVTDEVKLLVFRYSGDNHPFVAVRRGNILHVIFIESQFGVIYDHKTK